MQRDVKDTPTSVHKIHKAQDEGFERLEYLFLSRTAGLGLQTVMLGLQLMAMVVESVLLPQLMLSLLMLW
eukprot:12188454-Karenia_brevis.AAC.1